MAERVEIVEVGPRDGLQNEAVTIPTPVKAALIRRLVGAGLRRIEATSFVHPKWIPQLADAVELVNSLDFSEPVRYSALVPNLRGLERALQTPIREVAVFMSASESHNRSNINKSIAETFPVLAEVVQEAKKRGLTVRGYVSTAFGCPFEGAVPMANVMLVVEKLVDMGVDEISVGDTIGVATPNLVRERFRELRRSFPDIPLAGHFHDTYGMAVANVLAAMEEGIRIFDSAIGGLGGCPYAPGASGNLSTEDLVYLLHGMGIETGVDMDRLVEAGQFVQQHLGKTLPSRVLQAKTSKACQVGRTDHPSAHEG
ncbi:MAG: hydroxymethylglutaryl-CoA lyase [Bacillaceae bacterium G1]|nr:MAG: hydroxymethylglutaryl-CoA lyase [Bacillaceae bacterium G1]